MKKIEKYIIAVITLIAIGAIGTAIYFGVNKINKGNNVEINKDTESIDEPKGEATISFVCSGFDRNIYGLKTNGDIVKIVNDGNIMHDAYDISDKKLYYVDKDYLLHSVLLNENYKNNNLGIKISENFWNLDVDGNHAIVFGNDDENIWYQEVYEINSADGQVKILPFISGNTNYFINDTYFFTDYTTRDLKAYNINTSENKIISANSTIQAAKKNIIVYEKDKNMYKYDITNRSSKIIKEAIASNSMEDDWIVISNDDIYFINNNYLYINKNDISTKLLKLNSDKYDEIEYDLFSVNDNKILIIEEGYKYENNECAEICDSGGTLTYYYYNIKLNKLEETKNDYSILNECSIRRYYK